MVSSSYNPNLCPTGLCPTSSNSNSDATNNVSSATPAATLSSDCTSCGNGGGSSSDDDDAGGQMMSPDIVAGGNGNTQMMSPGPIRVSGAGSSVATPFSFASVQLSAGAFSFELPLLSVGSLGGIGWAFGLNYLSGNGVNGIVGPGFNYPDNLSLHQNVGGGVTLYSGQNTVEVFNFSGGAYTPAPGNNTAARLTRSGSGATDAFTLTSSKGVQTVFFGFASPITTPGLVKSITDRFGNQQAYTWAKKNGVYQLQSVMDSYGRTINYSYYGSEQGYLLSQITDFVGRQLNFQYDSAGRLVAVVTPNILQAAQGNTFPGGTAYVFEYDANNPRPQRQNDLIKIWYPNQTQPFLNTTTRVVDVASVYASATPVYFVQYGQDPTDETSWGRVVSETIGDPANGVGGTYTYSYVTQFLPTNLIDPTDPIVFRAIMTDRNGNQTIYDFNANQMPSCVTKMRTRSKIDIPSFSAFPSYVTWTKYNANNQPLVIVYPEGDSVEFTYDSGVISGLPTSPYAPRVGLLLSRTRLPGNSIGIPSRAGSNGQTQLTQSFFYEPIYNQVCAMIEERGNPINGSDGYFTPQKRRRYPDRPTAIAAVTPRSSTMTIRKTPKPRSTTIRPCRPSWASTPARSIR